MVDNNICNQHSGFKAKIETLEDNVLRLWNKWDSMQKTVLGVFVVLSMNLVGVIVILIMSIKGMGIPH